MIIEQHLSTQINCRDVNRQVNNLLAKARMRYGIYQTRAYGVNRFTGEALSQIATVIFYVLQLNHV